MMKKTLVHLSVGLTTLFSPFAFSQSITVLNGNYESDTVPLSTQHTDFISGWVNTGFGDIGVEIPLDGGLDYTGYATQGQAAYMEAGGRISQTVPTTVRKDETYTLTYDVGRPLGETGHHFVARFKSEGLVLAQAQTSASDVVAGTWKTQTLSFTATEDMPLDKPLVVEFYNLSSTNSYSTNLDNVSVTIAGTGVDAQAMTEQPVIQRESAILGTTTFNIPIDFADLNEAMRYLNDRFITRDSIVTINISSCNTTTYTSPVLINHPQANQIHIIGNVSEPQSCVLSFEGSHGLVVQNSAGLGFLDGFTFTGNDTPSTTGILAQQGAYIRLGANVRVNHFENGISAHGGASIYARSTRSEYNTNDGYVASFGGYVDAQGTVGSHNQGNGFNSENMSYVVANNASGSLNDKNGFEGRNFGNLWNANSSADSNGHNGFLAHQMSRIDALNAYSSSSEGAGFKAESLSTLRKGRSGTSSFTERSVSF